MGMHASMGMHVHVHVCRTLVYLCYTHTAVPTACERCVSCIAQAIHSVTSK